MILQMAGDAGVLQALPGDNGPDQGQALAAADSWPPAADGAIPGNAGWMLDGREWPIVADARSNSLL